MFALVAAWESADQTRIEFCRRHNLSVSVFAYWRKKYVEQHKTVNQDFKEILPQLNEQVEICYPNGVKINLPANGQIATIQALIGLV